MVSKWMDIPSPRSFAMNTMLLLVVIHLLIDDLSQGSLHFIKIYLVPVTQSAIRKVLRAFFISFF